MEYLLGTYEAKAFIFPYKPKLRVAALMKLVAIGT